MFPKYGAWVCTSIQLVRLASLMFCCGMSDSASKTQAACNLRSESGFQTARYDKLLGEEMNFVTSAGYALPTCTKLLLLIIVNNLLIIT